MGAAQPVTPSELQLFLGLLKYILCGKYFTARIVRFELAGDYAGVLWVYGNLNVDTAVYPYHFKGKPTGSIQRG